MNLHSTTTPVATDFDLLRARLESDLPRPAVFAITSSTPDDGREVAAQGLAYAFASAGYKTVFIDTSLESRSLGKPAQGLDLQEIVRGLSGAKASGNLTVLTLSDAALQKRSSQRNVQAAFDTLRASFDYIVVSTEPGITSSFGASIISVADGVLTSIKSGRRIKSNDARLGNSLKSLGEAFLGVLVLDPSVTKSDPSILTLPTPNTEMRRSQSVHAEAGV